MKVFEDDIADQRDVMESMALKFVMVLRFTDRTGTNLILIECAFVFIFHYTVSLQADLTGLSQTVHELFLTKGVNNTVRVRFEIVIDWIILDEVERDNHWSLAIFYLECLHLSAIQDGANAAGHR